MSFKKEKKLLREMITGAVVKVGIMRLRTSDSGKGGFTLSGDPPLPEMRLALFQDTVPGNSPSSVPLPSKCNCPALDKVASHFCR